MLSIPYPLRFVRQHPCRQWGARALPAPSKGLLHNLILVDDIPLKNRGLVADPDKNFVMIMKDGKIYKNTVR